MRVAVMGLWEELGLTELNAPELQSGGETASDSIGGTDHTEHSLYDEVLSAYESGNVSSAPSADVGDWDGHRERKRRRWLDKGSVSSGLQRQVTSANKWHVVWCPGGAMAKAFAGLRCTQIGYIMRYIIEKWENGGKWGEMGKNGGKWGRKNGAKLEKCGKMGKNGGKWGRKNGGTWGKIGLD